MARRMTLTKYCWYPRLWGREDAARAGVAVAITGVGRVLKPLESQVLYL